MDRRRWTPEEKSKDRAYNYSIDEARRMVEKMNDSHYTVKSFRRGEIDAYDVYAENNYFTCSCPAFESYTRTCKHLYLVHRVYPGAIFDESPQEEQEFYIRRLAVNERDAMRQYNNLRYDLDELFGKVPGKGEAGVNACREVIRAINELSVRISTIMDGLQEDEDSDNDEV